MDLKNSPSDKKPSKVILVTGAICLSVLLASISYKITLSKSAVTSKNIAIGTEGTTTDSNVLITNALQDAQISSLEEANATSTNPFTIQAGDSVSDRLTKTIFTGYQYAQQADGVTDDSINQVNDAVFSQVSDSDLPKPAFSARQVRVFVPSSHDQIRLYGNNLAQIILQNYAVIRDNKDKYLDNIKNVGIVYQNIGNQIIQQQTPLELQANQADLANSFFVSGSGMQMVADQDKDPVKSMLGLKVVKEMDQLQSDMLTNIASYLNNNDIMFSSNESGSFWNQYMNINNDQSTSSN